MLINEKDIVFSLLVTFCGWNYPWPRRDGAVIPCRPLSRPSGHPAPGTQRTPCTRNPEDAQHPDPAYAQHPDPADTQHPDPADARYLESFESDAGDPWGCTIAADAPSCPPPASLGAKLGEPSDVQFSGLHSSTAQGLTLTTVSPSSLGREVIVLSLGTCVLGAGSPVPLVCHSLASVVQAPPRSPPPRGS